MIARLLFPFALAARLMRQLRLPTKLVLMGVLLAAPMLMMVLWQVERGLADIALTRSERHGARAVAALVQLAGEVQAHRDVSTRLLAGDDGAGDLQQQVRKRLRNAVHAVHTIGGEALPFDFPNSWSPLREAALALADGRHSDQVASLRDEHERVLRQARHLGFLLADRSQLLLDPQASTYHLMEVLVQRMLPLSDALGAARGRGAAMLAGGPVLAGDRGALLGHAQRIGDALEDLALHMQALERAGAPPPTAWAETRVAAERLAHRTHELLAGQVADTSPEGFFTLGTQGVDAAQRLGRQVAEALIGALEAREATAIRVLLLQAGLALVGGGLVLVLGIAFYTSFYGAVNRLLEGVETVAQGDLSHRITIRGADEVAEIGALVERMNERLSALVAEIRSSAARVGMAGHQVADGSVALAERTEQQAASLRQTLALAQGLSTAVASNATAVADLDHLTGRLRADAEAGGAAMRETLQNMADLETTARRVAEIVGVIDAIAFQTNILALNAAVEAARAGAAGKGFAVVAAEVRQLASRVASAAREIRSLIGQSSTQVDSSAARIRNVGALLDSLVHGVHTASDSLRKIADASATQSRELDQVAQGVHTLNQITQRNAEMVMHSTSASRELVARAASLSHAVDSIRLRQGSADEAQALVMRALALIRREGLASAAAELHSREAGFVDRDLYVFVIDRVGHYVLHGAKPPMEGRRVHEVPGIDGTRFVIDAWAAAERGGGWIDYDIVNPETGVVQPKTSYIVALDDAQIVGCGIYRVGTSLAQEAATPGSGLDERAVDEAAELRAAAVALN